MKVPVCWPAIADAFSGDAIPIHLLTQEAFTPYLRHLKDPTGILAFHVSNNALDLTPVVARLAAERGISAWSWRGLTANGWERRTASECSWGPRGMVPDSEHMIQITPNLRSPLWTDDCSDLIRVVVW